MSLLVSRYYSHICIQMSGALLTHAGHASVILLLTAVLDSGRTSWDGSSVSLSNTFSAAFFKYFLLHEHFTCIFTHQHSLSILFMSNFMNSLLSMYFAIQSFVKL